MPLLPANQKSAGEFLNSTLWQDLKRCLMERRPPAPEFQDDPHVAAAKGHARAGFEKAIEELQKIPFEIPEIQKSPFGRPAVAITED